MPNIPRPPYSMLGYNRTITPTNIRFAQHWARGGGGRKKKRGKNSNLPNRLFYRLSLQGFFSRFWSPSRTGQVPMLRTRGFWEGQTFLTKVKRVGEVCRSITSEPVYRRFPPPLPSEKKCGFFFEEGGGVCTHRLAAAGLAIQSLRRRQPYSTDKSSCNSGNLAKRGLSIFGFKFWGS